MPGPTPSPTPGSLDNLDQQLAAAAANPGAGVASSAPVMSVYMGATAGSTKYAGKEMPDGMALPAPTETVLDQNAAENQIYTWSSAQRKKWEKQLLDAGLIKPGQYNFADLVQMWQGAVEGSAALYTYGSKKVTPQAYVKNFLGVQGAAGNGSTTSVSTSKNVQHFDDLDARGVALDEYQSNLGRAATPDETAALQHALNAYAASHPSISKTTTTSGADGNSHSNTVSSGGIDQTGVDALSQQRIQQTPEYGSYQAASTYYNALEGALDSPDLGVMGV